MTLWRLFTASDPIETDCAKVKMSSFTKISDDGQPVITLNPAIRGAKIEDNTYGGFTE